LVFGVEVDTGVAVGFRFHICLEMEIFEGFVIADIKNVASLTVANQGAIFDFPAGLVLIYFPAIHRLAIEKAHKSGFGIRLARFLRKGTGSGLREQARKSDEQDRKTQHGYCFQNGRGGR
jgi:hypothetical protein